MDANGQYHAPAGLTLGRIPDTRWLRGWIVPIAGLDDLETRKPSCPCQNSKPDRPARRPVAVNLQRYLRCLPQPVAMVKRPGTWSCRGQGCLESQFHFVTESTKQPPHPGMLHRLLQRFDSTSRSTVLTYWLALFLPRKFIILCAMA